MQKQNLGAIRGYAGGGFIDGLKSMVGMGPKETVTEKFARQDAEFKAKHPERFQTPSEQPISAENAISGYAGMTALQKREKAAGLKAGGMVKKCVTGGKIAGPGGPTDDMVPIMASNGEFMIKASSAKILGDDVLEALNDLGDEPKNPKDDEAEDAKEGEMKTGGMVRKMFTGGKVNPNDTSAFFADPNAQARTAEVAKMDAEQAAQAQRTSQLGMQDAAQQPGSQMMNQSMIASRQAAENGEVPASSQSMQSALGQAQTQANGLQMKLPGTAPQDPRLQGAPSGFMAGGGMVRKPVLKMETGGDVEKKRQELIAQIPGSGTAPAPDGYSNGNDFTRNVNNSLNALGGMGVVASVPLKSAAIAGNSLARLNNAGVGAAQIAGPARQAPNFIAGTSGVAQVGGANLPTVIQAAPAASKMTNVALQEGAKANQMAAATRSLGNASAGMGMLDSRQAPLQQQGVQSAPSSSPVTPPLDEQGNPVQYGEKWRKLGEALNYSSDREAMKAREASQSTPVAAPVTAGAGQGMSSVQDRSVNPYATTPPTRGPSSPTAAPSAASLNDPYSNASIIAANPAGAVRKTVDANGRTSYSGGNVSGVVGFTDANGKALAGGPKGGFVMDGAKPLGMTRSKAQLEGDILQRQLAAQDEYLAAGDDPVKLKAAERKLMVLNGKKDQQDEYAYAPGGQVVIDGQLVTQPGVIFNKRTGQPQGGAQGGQQAAKPTYEVGKVYKDAGGNRAKWNGKDFVPV